MALGNFTLSGPFNPYLVWTGAWSEEGLAPAKPNPFKYGRNFDDGATNPASWPLSASGTGVDAAYAHPSSASSVFYVNPPPAAGSDATEAVSAPLQSIPMPSLSEWKGSFSLAQAGSTKPKIFNDKFILHLEPDASSPNILKAWGCGGAHLGAYNLDGTYDMVSKTMTLNKLYTGKPKQKSPHRPRAKPQAKRPVDPVLADPAALDSHGAEGAGGMGVRRTARERRKNKMLESEDFYGEGSVGGGDAASTAILGDHDEYGSMFGDEEGGVARRRREGGVASHGTGEEGVGGEPGGAEGTGRPSGKRKRAAGDGEGGGGRRRKVKGVSGEGGDGEGGGGDAGDGGKKKGRRKAEGDEDADGEAGVEGGGRKGKSKGKGVGIEPREKVGVSGGASASPGPSAAQVEAERMAAERLAALDPRTAAVIARRKARARAAADAASKVPPRLRLHGRDKDAALSVPAVYAAHVLPPEAGPAAGELYEGEMLNSMPHGFGTAVYRTGLMYEGTWGQGREYGWGVISDPDDRVLYEGEVADGAFNGAGVYLFGNGDKYTGGWRDGLPHGKGIFAAVNGASYDGEWVDGQRHGLGIMTFPNGATYVGSWRYGQKHGRGELSLPDGFNYRGGWTLDAADTTHGKGNVVYPDGSTYEGGVRDGKREGRGTYNFVEGQTYSGKWRGDAMDEGAGPVVSSSTSASSAGFSHLHTASPRQGQGEEGSSTAGALAGSGGLASSAGSPSSGAFALLSGIGSAALPGATGTMLVPRPVRLTEDEYIIPIHAQDFSRVHSAAGFNNDGH